MLWHKIFGDIFFLACDICAIRAHRVLRSARSGARARRLTIILRPPSAVSRWALKRAASACHRMTRSIFPDPLLEGLASVRTRGLL
jgi:hypothetical protein